MKSILNKKVLIVVFVILALAAVVLGFYNKKTKPAEGEIVVRFVDMLGDKEDGRVRIDSIMSDPSLTGKFTYLYMQQQNPQFSSHVSTYQVDMNGATIFTDAEGTNVYAKYNKILTNEELVKIAKELY